MSKFIYLDSNYKEVHPSVEKRIECHKKKCNHCCYNDSFLMYLFDEKAIRAIFNKVKSNEYNKVLPPEKGLSRPCPMLNVESGKCSIYEDRPLQCRSYHSTSEKACISLKQYNMDKPDDESDIKHQILKLEKKKLIKIIKASENSETIKRDVLVLLAEFYLKKNNGDVNFDSFYKHLSDIVNSDSWKTMKSLFPGA